MATEMLFHIADYVVLVIFLLISMAIGVYYGFFRKQKTTEEYLLGNRQMHLLPVALSLLVTFQSAISVMGVPMEVYVYNTMNFYIFLGIMMANFIQAMVIAPLVYPLKLTSTYEYLGQRFQSRSVQLLGASIGMLQTLLYMAIVLFAPALALEAVAGIPLWISVILIGAIGTIYTSVGGIKSVIWTDVFQFVILFGGLILIIILGTMKIGTLTKTIEIAYDGNRIIFDRASFDPRVRHSVWSTLIGSIFMWLPNCCNQSAVQRMCAMRSLRDSKIAVLLNIPLVLMYGVILVIAGLMLFSYFTVQQCDPLSAGFISNQNQLMPYFVMRVLSNVPGLAGLFIAALFSGALSSLSSGINSMAANTIQDFLINVLQDKTQITKTLIVKLIVLIYGVLTVALSYLAQHMSGPVTQIAGSSFGACGGPIVGIIFLGAIFPQANWIGALVGGVIGITLNVWIAVGSILYGTKSTVSEKIPTTGCFANMTLETNNTLPTGGARYTKEMYNMVSDTIHETTTYMRHDIADEHLAIYDVSYLYFGLIGLVVTLVIGLVVSLATGMDRDCPTEPKYIFPCLRSFWRSGYTGVSTIRTYSAVKMKSRNGYDKSDIVIPQVAPIKSLNLDWINKQDDDML